MAEVLGIKEFRDAIKSHVNLSTTVNDKMKMHKN